MSDASRIETPSGIDPKLTARLQRLVDEDRSAARAQTGLGCFVYLLPLGALATIPVSRTSASWWPARRNLVWVPLRSPGL